MSNTPDNDRPDCLCGHPFHVGGCGEVVSYSCSCPDYEPEMANGDKGVNALSTQTASEWHHVYMFHARIILEDGRHFFLDVSLPERPAEIQDLNVTYCQSNVDAKLEDMGVPEGPFSHVRCAGLTPEWVSNERHHARFQPCREAVWSQTTCAICGHQSVTQVEVAEAVSRRAKAAAEFIETCEWAGLVSMKSNVGREHVLDTLKQGLKMGCVSVADITALLKIDHE